jgi:ABC-type phosphate/phosphonate transport system permease subunit
MGGAVGLAILGSVMTNRFSSDFVAKLPETIKTLIPPQVLALMTHNPEVLVSPQAQDQLKTLLSQTGPQGAAIYQQTLGTLRQALNSGLAEVFAIALVITILAFVINFFLKEIPLRKQHVLAEGSGTTEKPIDN